MLPCLPAAGVLPAELSRLGDLTVLQLNCRRKNLGGLRGEASTGYVRVTGTAAPYWQTVVFVHGVLLGSRAMMEKDGIWRYVIV